MQFISVMVKGNRESSSAAKLLPQHSYDHWDGVQNFVIRTIFSVYVHAADGYRLAFFVMQCNGVKLTSEFLSRECNVSKNVMERLEVSVRDIF